MTREEAERAVKKHGGQRQAANALGVGRKVIRYALKGQPVEKKDSKTVRSIADFRKVYDKDFIVPTKVRAQLKAMGSGWLYESDFAKEAGVGLSDLGRYRDQFADKYVVQLRDGRKVWAGTPSMAKQMREMI